MLGRACAWTLLFSSMGCATATPVRPTDRDGGAIDGAILDAGVLPITDAFVEPATDAYVSPEADAHVAPGTDAGPGPGRGRYLDRCTSDVDCASLRCVDDYGPTRFCSRPCTSDAQCAHEHVCVAGFCVFDDTGTPCTTAAPETCATGLCVGSRTAGQCTRDCTTADDCPAGYACTTVSGSMRKVCVDVERPCSEAADCGTGLCIAGLGCTAACTSASDCPRRLTALGLSPYACAAAFGSTFPICVPPDDIAGDDPIGASCAYDAMGRLQCRSGACDDSAPLGPMCVQACTPAGGCAPGLGCYPLVDGASVHLVCELAGSGDLGQSCASARQCHSGLCDASGYCTRLCADGLCPSDMTCTPVPGTSVAICRR